MSKDILEILFGLGEGESLDGLCGLVGVLVVDPEISGGGLGDCIGEGLPLEVNVFFE